MGVRSFCVRVCVRVFFLELEVLLQIPRGYIDDSIDQSVNQPLPRITFRCLALSCGTCTNGVASGDIKFPPPGLITPRGGLLVARLILWILLGLDPCESDAPMGLIRVRRGG